MNYVSTKYFEFPIKAYDVKTVIQAAFDEEQGKEHAAPVISTLMRKKCIPEDILGWIQSGNEGQSIEELEETGFPCTIVVIKENLDTREYECSWDIVKFEERLNKHMAGKTKL